MYPPQIVIVKGLHWHEQNTENPILLIYYVALRAGVSGTHSPHLIFSKKIYTFIWRSLLQHSSSGNESTAHAKIWPSWGPGYDNWRREETGARISNVTESKTVQKSLGPRMHGWKKAKSI